ncbi:transporter substrate-binding domain-containing protein [Undibacterium arcticum]|uniref:Transporter substrate-binding domain-containing protein n=1 Tax=Undibacterium arcticum TaxID=1762892 RepID=A0ABV7F2G5_9BURK
MRANVPGLQIVRYQDDATVVQALIAHQIDAAAIPDGVAKDVMKQQADAGLAIKFTFFHQPNAMAVRLEDQEMRDWLNKAIIKMTGSGELNKISRKWTGNPLIVDDTVAEFMLQSWINQPAHR